MLLIDFSQSGRGVIQKKIVLYRRYVDAEDGLSRCGKKLECC
jgi:hypothetical protein